MTLSPTMPHQFLVLKKTSKNQDHDTFAAIFASGMTCRGYDNASVVVRFPNGAGHIKSWFCFRPPTLDCQKMPEDRFQ